MGSQQSTQKYNKLEINSNDIQNLNSKINKYLTNVTVNQASTCSAKIVQLQTINLTDLNVGGDVNIGDADVSQQSALTFDCLNPRGFKDEMANGLVSEYMEEIIKNFDPTTLQNIEDIAQTKISNNLIDKPVNVDYNFTNINTKYKNIANILQLSISNAFKLNDISDCSASVRARQVIDISDNIVGGNITVGKIRQDQAVQLFAKCIQDKQSSNSISSAIMANLGLTTNDNNNIKSSTSINGQTSNTQTSDNQTINNNKQTSQTSKVQTNDQANQNSIQNPVHKSSASSSTQSLIWLIIGIIFSVLLFLSSIIYIVKKR